MKPVQALKEVDLSIAQGEMVVLSDPLVRVNPHCFK